MTLEEARERVGSKVVYRSHPSRPGEEGVITSVNGTWVFVRYGSDADSQPTPPDMLEFVQR